MKRLRVALLTLYPVETASTRQRIHKNVRFFPEDLQATIFPGICSAAVRRLERWGGGTLARLAFLVEELARKLAHLWRARQSDVIVVQKGLSVLNVRGLPALLFALGKPVVFDFDDAVHLEAPQAFRSRWLRLLVDARQIDRLIERATAVVAGNRYLAEAARKRNPNVHVIVTPMDTDWYRPKPPKRGGRLVIGWSGSTTTNHYVERLVPILAQVVKRHPDVELRIISNDPRQIDLSRFARASVAIRFVPWRLDSLVEDLLELDVGLMPLKDDPWSRSKCGGKILQYMACGIPPVASPVGINTEVVEPGVTGFLAGEDAEWVRALILLIEDPALRARIGAAARRKVEAEHSNYVTAPQLVAVLREAALGREPSAGLAGSEG